MELSLTLSLVSTGLLVYLTCLGAYRLLFHPLARFPGPKLAGLTKWYEFYFDVVKGHGGQFVFELERLHDVYGPIVRINPDELHVRCSDWYEVLYAPSRRDKWPPAAHMVGAPLSTFGTVSHEVHRKRRNALNSLFSAKSLSEIEPVIHTHVSKLSDSLKDFCRTSKVVLLRPLFLALSTDVICSAAFEKPMGLQDDMVQAVKWSETIMNVAETTPIGKQFPFLIDLGRKLPDKFVKAFQPSLWRLIAFQQEMYEQASRFLAEVAVVCGPSDDGDESDSESKPKVKNFRLFHRLYDANKSSPQDKTVERFGQEGFSLLAAGGETTSRVLTIAVFYILDNAKLASQLHAELKEAIPGVNTMAAVAVISKVAFLTALINETLRIAAFNTSRLPLQSSKVLEFEQWKIPPGIPVSMTARDVLLDPKIFPEPHAFCPERWLTSDGEIRKDLNRYLVTFRKGTRNCPGTDMAWHELYLALAMIFRRFELELYDTVKERDIDVVRDCFLGMPHPSSSGPKVKVVREYTE